MKHAPLLSLFAAALLSAACSSTRTTSSEVKPATPAAGANDPAIESMLYVLNPRIVFLGEGRRLELDLHNKESQALEFQFTIDWFDKSGRPITSSATGWTRLSLGAEGIQPLQISPMPAQACSWRLRYLPTDSERG
jgi:hypothetical protein